MDRLTASLVHRIDAAPAGNDAAPLSERERALARLIRFIAQLVDHLQVEVASEGLYDLFLADEPGQAGFENA
jgi:hypothetical protein